jgi:hypothetical protein
MYFTVDSTNVDAGPVTCTDGSTPIRYYDPSTAPAVCSACSCGGPSITCNAHFRGWEDSTCLGNVFNFDVGNNVCTNTGSAANGIQTQGVTSTATCSPSGPVETPSPIWAQEHSLCPSAALPEATCDGGETCVEDGSLPLCIQAEGDIAACPAGWETAIRYQHYTSAVDNRGCDACSCTPPAQNLCDAGSFQIFNNATCTGAPATSAGENVACISAISSLSVKYVAPPPGAAACAPAGGSPNGSISTGPVAATLCCRD